MKTILELLNEIECPVVRERAKSQIKPIGKLSVNKIANAVEVFADWNFLAECYQYWLEISYFFDEYKNIDSDQSLQFEKFLPENYQGIKREDVLNKETEKQKHYHVYIIHENDCILSIDLSGKIVLHGKEISPDEFVQALMKLK